MHNEFDQKVKIIPHSSEAEISVLGNIIRHPYLLEDAIVQLSYKDFFSFNHQTIFKCLVNLNKQGIKNFDLLIVAEKFAETDTVDSDEAFLITAEIANNPYSENGFNSHVAVVLEKAQMRRALQMLNEVQQKIFSYDSSAIEFLRNELSKIETNVASEVKSFSSILAKTLLQIDVESQRGTSLVGLSSGISSLDFYTNGFQPGQLIVIGARPSVGKTVFMLNIAEYVAIRLLKTAVVFSMEMSETELTKRTLSRFARVKGIFSGTVSENDWSKIEEATMILEKGNFFIDDRAGLTVNEIRAKCRKIKSMEGKIDAIFIDYLGLMRGEGENETLKLGNITRELKILAKDLETPIILLSQLNRESAKRTESTPKLIDLRQSGSIEQDADIVILLERIITEKNLTVHIAKNRNGQAGSFQMIFNSEFFEFKEFGL